MSNKLFPMEPAIDETQKQTASGTPRVQQPNRNQLCLRPLDLEGLLPQDHRARTVWAFVKSLDLTPLYQKIRAVEGRAGRNAIDPAILMALWLYATVEGVGSARALDRLCATHNAYQWICGGVSVNYHSLADFRTDHEAILNNLLTQSVASLMKEGLVDLNRVSQDGIRVRANAGAASFRRKPTLKECLAEAELQVKTLSKEINDDPGASSKREEAARRRVAEDRQNRIKSALKHVEEIEAKKKSTEEKEKARASTTDPEARVMKMGDGGFRPAFNGQFAVDTKSQIVVGVQINNSGADQDKLPPMLDEITERYGKTPEEMLVDGGFASHAAIEHGARKGCKIFTPVLKSTQSKLGPHEIRASDSAEVAEWRARMATEEAKGIYKDRAATVECVNALARNRGLQRFLVRGLIKTKAVMLWIALTHNMIRAHSLRACAVGTA